jgi:HD-GYP domain-containing protein (c-di-GMP phosphodiesterase class II)
MVGASAGGRAATVAAPSTGATSPYPTVAPNRDRALFACCSIESTSRDQGYGGRLVVAIRRTAYSFAVASGNRLAELVGALSVAADLGAGCAPEAAIRMTVLATDVGRAVGLSGQRLRDVYYTALLRYLGCSGYAHEESFLAAGDDLGLLAALEPVDATDVAGIAKAAFTEVARDAGLFARAQAIARLLGDPNGFQKLARAHCDQATTLASTLGVGAGTLAALGQIYERWDGRGQPEGRAGADIAEAARVLHVANAVEIHLRRSGPAGAVAFIRSGRGKAFDPALADAFLDQAAIALARVTGPTSWEAYLDAEPAPHALVDPARTADVALAFARYVDLKSPFTLGHSTGVASVAAAAAEAAGLSAEDRETVRIAAWLHDLGRASVSNGTWDRPGPLGAMERERVELHALHGERIVARCAALAPAAPLVGRHHERLDGSGYHRQLAGGDIAALCRLLGAADVWHALGEARAHRPAFGRDAAIALLRDEAAAGRLDPKAVGWVLEGAIGAPARVRPSLPKGLTEREVEVLSHLARGRSNKEIGAALFISPRTVKVHVEHIYQKVGVSTRAAAALFAVTHDLVEARPS